MRHIKLKGRISLWVRSGCRAFHLGPKQGVVTLSQTERNLPTIANVDARDFSDLAYWLIVQIGPISLNVTTPLSGHGLRAEVLYQQAEISCKLSIGYVGVGSCLPAGNR